MKRQKEDAWQEAKRLCRLSDEEVRMAKELGFQPYSLIKNIPSSSERWKAPVNVWVRSLYEKKIVRKRAAVAGPRVPTELIARGEELDMREHPWPDNPEIPELPDLELDETPMFDPPDEPDYNEELILNLRRQRRFRWAAQAIAVMVSKLQEVEKVAAIGEVSRPLEIEEPNSRNRWGRAWKPCMIASASTLPSGSAISAN
ncbi:MAG TPA: hypothetical protein VKU01_25455 [Bryobacteraceae bacterium]|nr:hypothetical protein [Bryobacteraceae bacterium]